MLEIQWKDSYPLRTKSDLQRSTQKKSSEPETSTKLNTMKLTYVNLPEDKDKSAKSKDDEKMKGSQTLTNDWRCESPLSVLQQRQLEMKRDPRIQSDLVMGRRVGFYHIRNLLGAGNFSQVKLAVHTLTGERVAVKILDKNKTDSRTRRLLAREVGNMEHVQHPRIIRLYEVIENLTCLYIFLEYAAGGELYSRIVAKGRLPERQARYIFGQIVSAIHYIHSLNIIHRDIKAENILFVEQDVVKLADFGFSIRATSNQNLTTFCGSPPYAAPELFVEDHYVGPPVDIWAMGVLLFFMVTGRMPFAAENIPQLKESITKLVYVLPVGVPEPCRMIIAGILLLPPKDRLTSSAVLKSRWLKGEEFVMASTEGPPGTKFSTESHPFDISDEDLQTRQILEGLGITDKHLELAKDLGVHSPINGAYRIMLHRVQWRRAESNMRRCFRKTTDSTGSDLKPIDHTTPPSPTKPDSQPVAVTISVHTKQGCQFCSIL